MRAWMLQKLLPFWADVGVDRRHGGFVERLTLDRRPAPDDYKRVRVQARQIYVFSHAHLLGAPSWAMQTARHGADFLFRHCWDDEAGGWLHLVAPDGTPLDRRRDTYDQAFVLHALAWLYRATGDLDVLAGIDRSVAFLDAQLADPAGGGFWEEMTPEGATDRLPRRQNPHMHLLEAFLALHQATDDRAWLDRAGNIVRLFHDRLFDAATGSLGEFFARDWRPAAGTEGRIREPGHHFEWVWLLLHYRRLTGDGTVLAPANALYGFAREKGLIEHGGNPPRAVDSVSDDGAVLAGSARLWPQTEAVKAALAREELLGEVAARLDADRFLTTVFEYLQGEDKVVWQDQIARDGTAMAEYIPASTLYHLFLCLSEYLRVRG
ncbi:MAG: hypothetical protein HKM95_06365 [Inquilinus sp.]|nr:hypothetical protein [Inquilinus sp.]